MPEIIRNKSLNAEPSPRLRVAAYCRVSTDQDGQQSSFANQVATWKDRITANPDWEFAGVYADEGISGTRADKRPAFQRMIQDCKDGRIDRILTKSISRFARNVIDSLQYTRELKLLGIGVIFEEEHINSLDPAAEMIFTILSAVAEQEARNISEHTKWGIRNGYKRGRYRQTVYSLYGYARGEDNKVVIVESEAKIVRMMYRNFLEGMNPNEIAANLNEMGISGKRGHSWQSGTVLSILGNEKYKGAVYLQKSYVKDFIDHKSVKNNGELAQTRIDDAHEAIVDTLTWDAVQEEMERRSGVVDSNGTRAYAKKNNPYSGKIFLRNDCHALLIRHSYANGSSGTWKCRWYRKAYRPVCHRPSPGTEAAARLQHDKAAAEQLPSSENAAEPAIPRAPRDNPPLCHGMVINHRFIREFFLAAWNELIDDNLQERRRAWESIRVSARASPLQKVRAAQMLNLTAAGATARMEEEVPEMIRTVLARIEVIDTRYADVFFLDGTMIHVERDSEY